MSPRTWIDNVTVDIDQHDVVIGIDDYRHRFRVREPVTRLLVDIRTTDPAFVRAILERLRSEFEHEPVRDPGPARAAFTDGPPALPPATARALPPAPIEGTFEEDEP